MTATATGAEGGRGGGDDDPVTAGPRRPLRFKQPQAPLPAAFVAQMEALLGAEAADLVAALGQNRPWLRALRADPAKVTLVELGPLLGRGLTPLPWCPHGAVLGPAPAGEAELAGGAKCAGGAGPEVGAGSGGTSSGAGSGGGGLGRHPAHLAGLFYLQEPSSMAPAAALAPEPGWRVIDLAAAPGGKTTQLAALVGPAGLVVANEVVGSRLRALHDNLDRWGAANVVTTSSPLDHLTAPGDGFDGALLDAPCSGEALFRRDPAAARHWSPAAVLGAARRQTQLLAAAARLVRPGGVLVYSTCTFNRAENEDQLIGLVAGAGHWELEDLSWLGGHPAWPSPGGVPTERAARFWPHRGLGEGQFVARLRRLDRPAPAPDRAAPGPGPSSGRGAGGRGRGDGRGGRAGDGAGHRPGRELAAAWEEFRRAAVPGFAPGPDRLVERREWLFLAPVAAAGFIPPELHRPGLPLGRLRPGRFEPHPGLATSLQPGQATEAVPWGPDDPALAAYLRGETVAHPGPDGWVLVCFHRWPLGWARRRGGVLKNAFPAHLRRQAAGRPS